MDRDIDMIEEEPEFKLDSQIFTYHIPIIGKIPIAFYIPPCAVYEELSLKIRKNGGRVIDQHECFSFQLKPELIKTAFTDYYHGIIYSAKWVVDSIAAKKCLNKDDYFMCCNIDEKAKMLNVHKKKKYTIIEGVKLYEILTNQKNISNNSNAFWQKLQNQKVLPERSAESMKNFWKKNQFKTLEEYLIDCIYEGTDFCLSFKEIPNPDFVRRFKQQYANEFLKLEALEEMDKNGNSDKEQTVQKLEITPPVKNMGRSIVQAQSPLSRSNSSSNLASILSSSLKEKQPKDEKSEDLAMKDTQEEDKEQFRYEFKKLQKLSKEALSYYPLEYSLKEPHIYLSIDKRSLDATSLEQELENHLSIRMKKFIPTNFDLVDYDRELFKKQMDLETVQITISRDQERETEYGIAPYYIRSVKRFDNEEGMFNRLQLELQQIAQEYGVSDEDVNKLFLEVCCSKGKLVEALKGQSFTKWNELEDLALHRGTESDEYKYLLKTKGYEEIIRRKKFLGI